MRDAEEEELDPEDVQISEADIERMQRANSPRTMGVMLTVFVATLIIMIGGLAAYYYYNVQKQGSGHEQSIRDNWDEIVLATTDLTNSFNQISDYNKLFDNTKGSFQETLNSSNRSLQDVSYNLQSVSGYAFSGDMVITKMSSFVGSYLDDLRELQSVVDKERNGLVNGITELDELARLSGVMNEAYDNLLVADKSKIISSTLPADLFKMSDGMKDLTQKYLDDKKQKGEAEDAEKSAADGVANKFMQAYMNKDADSMKMYLTDQAKAEFNLGILEDATEIKSFEITDTRKISDTKIEIDAKINKTTPDQGNQIEKRRFTMKKNDTSWLIDAWPVV